MNLRDTWKDNDVFYEDATKLFNEQVQKPFQQRLFYISFDFLPSFLVLNFSPFLLCAFPFFQLTKGEELFLDKYVFILI